MRTPILCAGILAALQPLIISYGDVLSSYTFGPDGTSPSILTPATAHPNVTAGTITPGGGVTLDLSNSQAPVPPSSPWLRVGFGQNTTTPAAAITNNAYFEFSLIANGGFLLDLVSLAFDTLRGGDSQPRGYVVRSSIDDFTTNLAQADIPTVRPTFTNVSVDLSGPAYQDLSSITFRIYSYSPGTGSTVEYDNIIINGITQNTSFDGITWTGAVNGLWDTTTQNWNSPGGLYVDGTPTSNVIFDDTGTNKNVIVDGISLNPNGVLFDNTETYTLSGGDVIIGNILIKKNTGITALDTVVSTQSMTVDGGALVVGATGALSVGNGSISAGATLIVESGGVLADTSGLQVNGDLTLNAATQTLAALAGGATGLVTLNGTALNVTNSSVYAGKITGTGGITKNSPGTLVLSGANDYTGGTTVSGGTLQLNHSAAASTGPVVVETGGALSAGAGIAADIVLVGGTFGVAATSTIPANVHVGADSIIATFNPATGSASNDLILTGMLQGDGNLTLLSANGNNPDSQAFRLRGAPSDYSGTITVTQSAKFELQTSVAVGSPMGTGILELIGGNLTNTQAGTYSLVNVRNNSGGDTTLGNNVRISGTGTAFFNMLGSAPEGSASIFGELLIGDGQGVASGATSGIPLTLQFNTVQLNGGNATFTPQPVGNTGFIAPRYIRLGAISEAVAGSGITMNGAATLTLTGLNTYTGATNLQSGTTVLGPGASIASSSTINVSAGAILDATAVGIFEVPPPQTVILNGSLSGMVALHGALAGSGTVNGPVIAFSGALVAPGNGPGILTVQNISIDSGSLLQVELAKTNPGFAPIPGFDYDTITATNAFGGVSPTVTLGGTLVLQVGAGLEQNDIFTLIVNTSADPVFGTFDGLPNGGLFSAGGQVFQISYADDSSTSAFELAGGNDVSLLVVPEPGAAALLIGGLAVTLSRRRRQGC